MTTARAGPDSPSDSMRIVAYLVTAGVAPLMVFVGPLLVGAWVDIVGLGEDQAARVYAANLAGAAVGGIAVWVLLRLLNWRHIVFAGIVIFIVGHLATIAAESYSLLLLTQLAAGSGAGMLMSMTIIAIGSTASPERIYGLWNAIQFVCAAIVAAILPHLISTYGLAAPFVTFALLGIAIIWVIPFFPRGGEMKPGGSSLAGTQRGTRLGIIGLTGFFIFLAVLPLRGHLLNEWVRPPGCRMTRLARHFPYLSCLPLVRGYSQLFWATRSVALSRCSEQASA